MTMADSSDHGPLVYPVDIIGGGQLVLAGAGRLLKAISDGGMSTYALGCVMSLGQQTYLKPEVELSIVSLIRGRGGLRKMAADLLWFGWGQADIANQMIESKVGTCTLLLIAVFCNGARNFAAAEQMIELMRSRDYPPSQLPTVDAVAKVLTYFRPFVRNFGFEAVRSQIYQQCEKAILALELRHRQDVRHALMGRLSNASQAIAFSELHQASASSEHYSLTIGCSGSWLAALAAFVFAMHVRLSVDSPEKGRVTLWESSGQRGSCTLLLEIQGNDLGIWNAASQRDMNEENIGLSTTMDKLFSVKIEQFVCQLLSDADELQGQWTNRSNTRGRRDFAKSKDTSEDLKVDGVTEDAQSDSVNSWVGNSLLESRFMRGRNKTDTEASLGAVAPTFRDVLSDPVIAARLCLNGPTDNSPESQARISERVSRHFSHAIGLHTALCVKICEDVRINEHLRGDSTICCHFIAQALRLKSGDLSNDISQCARSLGLSQDDFDQGFNECLSNDPNFDEVQKNDDKSKIIAFFAMTIISLSACRLDFSLIRTPLGSVLRRRDRFSGLMSGDGRIDGWANDHIISLLDSDALGDRWAISEYSTCGLVIDDIAFYYSILNDTEVPRPDRKAFLIENGHFEVNKAVRRRVIEDYMTSFEFKPLIQELAVTSVFQGGSSTQPHHRPGHGFIKAVATLTEDVIGVTFTWQLAKKPLQLSLPNASIAFVQTALAPLCRHRASETFRLPANAFRTEISSFGGVDGKTGDNKRYCENTGLRSLTIFALAGHRFEQFFQPWLLMMGLHNLPNHTHHTDAKDTSMSGSSQYLCIYQGDACLGCAYEHLISKARTRWESVQSNGLQGATRGFIITQGESGMSLRLRS